MASAKPLSGSSVYLWNDVWNGTLPKCIYPELFSFTMNKSLSLQKAKSLGPQFRRIFRHIPLSDDAFVQYEEFQNIISNLLSSDGKDRWEYI